MSSVANEIVKSILAECVMNEKIQGNHRVGGSTIEDPLHKCMLSTALDFIKSSKNRFFNWDDIFNVGPSEFSAKLSKICGVKVTLRATEYVSGGVITRNDLSTLIDATFKDVSYKHLKLPTICSV